MAVTALAFSNAQNGYLASASADTTAKIWDPLQGLLKKTLEGHTKVRRCSLLKCHGCLAKPVSRSVWCLLSESTHAMCSSGTLLLLQLAREAAVHELTLSCTCEL